MVRHNWSTTKFFVRLSSLHILRKVSFFEKKSSFRKNFWTVELCKKCSIRQKSYYNRENFVEVGSISGWFLHAVWNATLRVVFHVTWGVNTKGIVQIFMLFYQFVSYFGLRELNDQTTKLHEDYKRYQIAVFSFGKFQNF
jgi:hypothetical protein